MTQECGGLHVSLYSEVMKDANPVRWWSLSSKCEHHIQGQRLDQHLGQGEDKSPRYNEQCEKSEVVLGRAHQQPQSWTSLVTTWRPYDKKIRQGRPAKWWRDDLDKYWNETIAQDRLSWRQHAEAFAQPRDTTAAQ